MSSLMERNRRLVSSLVLALNCAGTGFGCRPAPSVVARAPVRLVMPTPAAPGPELTDLLRTVEANGSRLRVVVQPTAGSVLVVSQLQQGSGELGVAQSDVVYLAFRRGLSGNHEPHVNLRGVAVGGLNRLVVYVRRTSAIETLADLRGKRVAISPSGTAGELLTKTVLEASGITTHDIDMRVHQIRDMARYFDTEDLDAMIMVGTFDPDSYTSQIPREKLRIVSVDPPTIERLRAEYPFIKPADIAWHDAQTRLRTFHTVGADSLVIARKDVPEAVIYAFTAAIMQSVPRNNAFAIDPDLAPATPIPLHPGAARYYRELQLLR